MWGGKKEKEKKPHKHIKRACRGILKRQTDKRKKGLSRSSCTPQYLKYDVNLSKCMYICGTNHFVDLDDVFMVKTPQKSQLS